MTSSILSLVTVGQTSTSSPFEHQVIQIPVSFLPYLYAFFGLLALFIIYDFLRKFF